MLLRLCKNAVCILFSISLACLPQLAGALNPNPAGPAFPAPISIPPRCPYVITQPGIYSLDTDMVCNSSNQSAIVVQNTDHVTLRLNGHNLTGTKPTTNSTGASGIYIHDSQQVTVMASGTTIHGFGIAVQIDKSSNVSVRNVSSSPLMIDQDLGISSTSVTGLLLSSVSMQNLIAYGLYLNDVHQFRIDSIAMNLPSNSPSIDTGIYLNNSTSGLLNNMQLSKPIKGLMVSASSDVQVSKFNITHGGFEGIELTQAQNFTLSNVNIDAGTPIIVMGLGNTGNVFNGAVLKPMNGGVPACWVGASAPSANAIPQFLNTTPASFSFGKCPFWN